MSLISIIHVIFVGSSFACRYFACHTRHRGPRVGRVEGMALMALQEAGRRFRRVVFFVRVFFVSFFSIKINLHSCLLKERKCFPLETRSVSFEGSSSSKHRFQAEEFLVSLERHERDEHTISVCLGVAFDVSRNTSGVPISTSKILVLLTYQTLRAMKGNQACKPPIWLTAKGRQEEACASAVLKGSHRRKPEQ